MVKINWLSLIAPRKQNHYTFISRLYFFWIFLFYRWIFYIYNPFEITTKAQQKRWVVLSSPKCHKIGRCPINQRYLHYTFLFHFFHDKYVVYSLNNLLTLFYWLGQQHNYYTHNFSILLNFSIYLRCLLFSFRCVCGYISFNHDNFDIYLCGIYDYWIFYNFLSSVYRGIFTSYVFYSFRA
jgi:hypothetical protein